MILDPLHVEKVLEQRGESARLRVDDAEVVAAGRRVEVALEQERREAEHARERRPQLVRDDVDELRLRLLALAQLRVLLLQVGVVLLDLVGHLVEGAGQLADLAGAPLRQPQRPLAACQAARSARDRAHRAATDRAR